jgi:xylose isomerase
LWFSPNTIDGAYTSNDPKHRQYAIDRSLRCIEIGKILGTDLLVLWLAREGTYLREAKNGRRSIDLLVEAFDKMLAADKKVRLSIEPKPNEPMDHAYIPTIGHALAIAQLTRDPKRVGCLIESAHAILAGLDPADEIDFAMAFGKLWSLHLNDQNGLKFDQDKPFGSSNAMDTAPKANTFASMSIHSARQNRSTGLLISITVGKRFCAWLKKPAHSTKRRRTS